jgi:hypothetical protein
MYAVAAVGSKFALVPGLSHEDRMKCGQQFCEKARDLLLAGYLGRSTRGNLSEPGVISDIEAIQTLTLIFTYFVPLAGLNPILLPLLQTRLGLILEYCLDATTEGLAPPCPPSDVTDWILRELRVRTWAQAAIEDTTMAYHRKGELLYNWFQHPFRLACHELFWDMESPELAFEMMLAASAPFGPAGTVVDIQPLSLLTLQPKTRAMMIAELFRPCFAQSGSFGVIMLFNTLLRALRMQLRSFAELSGVKPLQICAQEPEMDSENERFYRQRAGHIDALAGDFFAVLPPDISGPFESGDLAPYFANWSKYFSDLAYAHAFFTGCVMTRCSEIEVWGDPATASAELLSSPRLAGVMQVATLVGRLLEGQLADDPSLRWSHETHFGMILRIGYVFLAAMRGGLSTRFERELVTVLRALERFAMTGQPVARARTDEFLMALKGAGIGVTMRQVILP